MIKHSLDFADFDTRTGRALVWGYPYAYRSAFLNQYFEDAIRSSHPQGSEVLYHASLFANYRTLKQARDSMRLKDEKDFLNFAKTLFMSFGYGSLLIEHDSIKLVSSPIAQTYLYVHHTPSGDPICSFQRGFVSAMLNVALKQPPGTIHVDEVECMSMQDPICRMFPHVKVSSVDFPDVNYSTINHHMEDDPTFMEKVPLLRKILPKADDTGNMHIPSVYGGLRRAAFLYFPADYFSYATWKALGEGDFGTADLTLRFTGYSGFLMTFVSLYYTPIGKFVFGDPETPEEIFKSIMGSMKYWGMGLWKVEEIGEGRAVARVHNFYENDFQRLVGIGEPYSPYVVGGIMGLLFAVYKVKFYLKEEPLFIKEAIQSYDEALETFRVKSSFDPEENAQIVEFEW